jgi:hypothetical protein
MEHEGGLMTDSRGSDGDKMPDDEELQEPSTEKDVGEEPKDPDADEGEPDHEAVGLGVPDGPAGGPPSSEDQASPPHPTAAETARADSAPPTSAMTDDVKRDAAGVDDSDGVPGGGMGSPT